MSKCSQKRNKKKKEQKKNSRHIYKTAAKFITISTRMSSESFD